MKPTTLSTVALQGFAFTLTLLKKLDPEGRLHQACGQLQLAFNAQEQKRQDKLFKQLHNDKQYDQLQFLDATAASTKANIDLSAGGLYLPEAGWVKPQAFCEALTQSKLITKSLSTGAIKLIQTSRRWQVLLDNSNTLDADIVVICNANDVETFDQCKNLPITAVRGQVNYFNENVLSKQLKTVVCSDHYLSPSIDGIHSIGTSYAPNDDDKHISDADTRANMLALDKISSPLFNSIDMSAMTGRVAWRSATRDFLPLAGQLLDDSYMLATKPRHNASPADLPWLNGLYINAGHGSKGMITAPLCGELIANLVNNEPLCLASTIASKLNPSRFTMRSLGLKELANALC